MILSWNFSRVCCQGEINLTPVGLGRRRESCQVVEGPLDCWWDGRRCWEMVTLRLETAFISRVHQFDELSLGGSVTELAPSTLGFDVLLAGVLQLPRLFGRYSIARLVTET